MQIQTYYSVDVYNKYVDNAFAHANLDDFNIEELLLNANPNIREFSFILIRKKIEKKGIVISKPIIAIYDKNIWKKHCYFTKERFNFKFNFHTEYSCIHHLERFDKNNLINIPCNSQEEMLSEFNIISKLLINKDRIKSKLLIKNK